MVTIWVCVGSSCFLRGASDVIKAFEAEIEQRAPRQAELKGTFCQDMCTMGVTVRLGSKVFTGVRPEDVPRLFEEEVVPLIERGFGSGFAVGGDTDVREAEGEAPDEASNEAVGRRTRRTH